MDDQTIIGLFFARDEEALSQVEQKYGSYCGTIARNILHNEEDAEECLSDAWLAVWNSIPPNQPRNLASFLARIVRTKAIDRWRSDRAAKRGGDQLQIALEELLDCADDGDSAEETVMCGELKTAINAFLCQLPDTERNVFLCRYWYFDGIGYISSQFGFRAGKVKSMLHRTRKKLQKYLKEEGFL